MPHLCFSFHAQTDKTRNKKKETPPLSILFGTCALDFVTLFLHPHFQLLLSTKTYTWMLMSHH